MTFPAQNFEDAVSNTITASDQLHRVINGTATETINTESGMIPSLRKALVDNFYFITPIPWKQGEKEEVFNQLRLFTDGSWWYAPSATEITPIPMGVSPHTDLNWVLSSISKGTIVQPTQLGDGIKTTFLTPSETKLIETSFKVTLDGVSQTPIEDFISNTDGSITFKDGSVDFVVGVGVKVVVYL